MDRRLWRWTAATTAAAVALAAVLPAHMTTTPAAHADAISRRPELITAETEGAIQRGLDYLAKSQSTSGAWGAQGGYGGYPTAMTSLAGLALLAGGSTPVEGKYANNIRKAVDYLMKVSNQNGLIADMGVEQTTMHGHGFAMLFLSQVYGMERDEGRREEIRKVLVKAVELTEKSQSRDGGWLYTPDANSDEGSVTVTQIQGLRGIRNAGIKVPKGVIEKAAAYIHKSANADGGIRYRASQPGPSMPPITAAAVSTLYNAGEYENPVALKALAFTKQQMKGARVLQMGGGHQFYMLLYGAQAMYLSGDENWNGFFPAVRDDLLKMQSRVGAESGSWNADGIGTTYATAIALLTLELPYKYLPILQR